MYIGKKMRIHSRSFHHRIRDREGQFIDRNQLLGIDPFDHSKFREIYKKPEQKKEEEVQH